MSRSYGVDDEIDMSELDDELAAIDEQLSLEAEVVPLCAVSLLLVCASTARRELLHHERGELGRHPPRRRLMSHTKT